MQARGQQPTPVKLSLDEIIKRAGERQAEYGEMFKDLRADETQTSEDYDAKGLKKRREIVSDLFVYQSRDQTTAVEYRNIRSVDGKPVSDSDHRAEKLFERLAKAKSLKTELEAIDKESRRYDLNSSFYGFTLNQGRPLHREVTRYYRFDLASEQQIAGHDVVVVDYKQTEWMPEEKFDLNLPKALQGAVPRFRGRVYLDRDTLRLRREEQELTLDHPSSKIPLVLFKWELNYGDSPYGILTPTRIVMNAFARGRSNVDGSPELLQSSRIEFSYSPFTRFDVKTDYKPN
jgi:hypothetical protein